VEQPRLRRFLQGIADTQDEEISCTECFDALSAAVDLEMGGTVVERALPRLWQHLQQCGVCREEYETLRDLVRLEADGRPPASSPS
jgi:predicted anti-sigma-YlaC factor YlaD